MLIDTKTLSKGDEIFVRLQKIYKSRGYKRFTFGRFEEYSLYSENKNFLLCENVLTFTAHDGRLLALKPDVTLSIVKNTNAAPDNTEKLFYRENVYRYDKSSQEYREINQVGVEILGNVDTVATYEIIKLATETFGCIDGNFILDISHMGYVAGLLEECGVTNAALRAKLLEAVAAKNAHDLKKYARDAEISEENIKLLCAVTTLCGEGEETVEKARKTAKNQKMLSALDELYDLFSLFDEETKRHIKIDFSMLNDFEYYNGIIFKGYLPRVPKAVLTGGRYDNLLKKYGKKNTGAMGFALYASELAPYYKNEGDVADILLIYKAQCDKNAAKRVIGEAEKLRAEGYSVRCETSVPEGCSFGKIIYSE